MYKVFANFDVHPISKSTITLKITSVRRGVKVLNRLTIVTSLEDFPFSNKAINSSRLKYFLNFAPEIKDKFEICPFQIKNGKELKANFSQQEDTKFNFDNLYPHLLHKKFNT